MAYSNPTVGTAGKFEFLAPFIAASDTEYTVVAVRSFVELEKNGISVFDIYYQSSGIAKDIYEASVRRDGKIISLRDGSGQIRYIPDEYIASAPDIGGVKYEQKILAINLGPLPKDIILEELIAGIGEYVTGLVGVVSTINLGTIQTIGLVTEDQHATLEAARLGRIASPETSLNEAIRLRTELDNMKRQYSTLFTLAKNNGLIT